MASGQLQMFTPIWQLFDNNGKPLTSGALFFFEADDHNAFKDVYIDDTGGTPWPNPIILNAAGFQPQNYGIFGSGAYYIEVRKTFDRTSQLIFSQDNYIPSASSGSGPVIPSTDIQNFILNPQFTLYGQQYSATGVSLPTSILTLAPGGWVFIKNDTSANDTITFPKFAAGQTAVPANPNNYFLYQCNSISSTENLKYLGYRFYDYSSYGLNAGSGVNTLAGQSVTMQFEGLSATNSAVGFSIYQYFGAAGSTPTLTPIRTFNLTSQWPNEVTGQPFNVTFTVPSIAGKTIDPAGGDYLELRWNCPLNTISQIGITNGGLQNLSSFINFQPVPINDLQSQLTGLQMPILTTQNNQYLDGSYNIVQEMGVAGFTMEARAGQVEWWPTNVAPAYALINNGAAYFSNEKYNLANALYDSNQGIMPWGTGIDGFTTSVALNVITATNYTNGAVSNGSAGTSGFTFVQTDPGSAGTQAIATITTTAGNVIIPGSYFLINAPTTSYYVWYCQNNRTLDPGTYLPALAGLRGIKVIYVGTETNAQIAALTSIQLLAANFLVPTTEGLFIRGRAAGSANDPDRTTRTALFAGSAAGDNTGSYQADQNLAHTHGFAGTNFQPLDTFGLTDQGNTRQSASSGGNQANPRNVYMTSIIYF